MTLKGKQHPGEITFDLFHFTLLYCSQFVATQLSHKSSGTCTVQYQT
jgi:hypothetical protein